MRSSLSSRLVISSFAWIGVALLGTVLLLNVLFRDHVKHHLDILLFDHVEELVAASKLTPDGALQMSWVPSDPRFKGLYSGWYWEILHSGASAARSDSLGEERLKVTEPGIGKTPRAQRILGPEDEPLYALAQTVTAPQFEEPILFVVAGPFSVIQEDVRAFTAKVAILLALLGIGLLLVVWFQVRFGLRPLRAMRKALGDIRKGKARRLPENYPVEMEQVADELNSLLDHNTALIERARTQVGNLAHALKNPLTVIRNEATAIGNERGRVIREQVTAMADNVDRYLSKARVAGTADVLGTRTDVKPIAEDLCFSMERLYKKKDLNIQCPRLESCWFRGEAQDLEEMLGNLMDNACKWARSQVLVRVERSGDRLLIAVEDDGPGIPGQRQSEALGRGSRLDEKVPGSGLGLGIVQDIAELYRGSITLGRAPIGGLSAQLDLPAAD